MSVRAESTVVPVADTVDELVTDPGWVAERDRVMAALHRTWLPVYGGTVRAALIADRMGCER